MRFSPAGHSPQRHQGAAAAIYDLIVRTPLVHIELLPDVDAAIGSNKCKNAELQGYKRWMPAIPSDRRPVEQPHWIVAFTRCMLNLAL
jgi:hypothetical protein